MTTIGANQAQATTERSPRGDAVVIRGIAAALVLLALIAALVIERPAAYGIAATILVAAAGFYAAARYRRAPTTSA